MNKYVYNVPTAVLFLLI